MIEPSEIEPLLARFRHWLEETRVEVNEPADGPKRVEGHGPDAREVGLYDLVEQFTALRHELKLQTKSARSVQEQAEAMLGALGQAIDQFRAATPREAPARGRSLAEALADLDDALERGQAQAARAAAHLDSNRLEAEIDALFRRQPGLVRWIARRYHEQVRRLAASAPERQVVAALLEGYDLIRRRLQRFLSAEGIERIACLDREVDAELMTVVDIVDEPGRPAGWVVEEIRPGYTWNGRVLRYAEVKAARGGAEPFPNGSRGA